MSTAQVASGKAVAAGAGARRLAVASRTAAAIFGGYLAASLAATLMALALPIHKAEAVALATLLSFVPYVCAVVWVFAVRTAARACLGLAGALALAWALVRLLERAAP